MLPHRQVYYEVDFYFIQATSLLLNTLKNMRFLQAGWYAV